MFHVNLCCTNYARSVDKKTFLQVQEPSSISDSTPPRTDTRILNPHPHLHLDKNMRGEYKTFASANISNLG